MRIFKYVFGGLFGLILLGVVGWILREKIVLAIASYQLRAEIADLKQIVYKGSMPASCGSGARGFQLRFVSETEYVMEPVCGEVDEDPFRSGRLFGGVRRLYGSGVRIELVEGIPDVKDAWVHLSYENSQSIVGLFDGLPKVVWEVEDYEIGGESPAQGRCEDWGFSCCQTGVEVGEFSKVRTYDCVNNCYQHCNRLPLVLYFNTDPIIDSRDRVVEIYKSDPVVSFGYSVSDDEEGLEVEIDFGDGKTSGKLLSEETELQHEYRCLKSSCVYQVLMRAKDKSGNGLVESDLNKMMVIVR